MVTNPSIRLFLPVVLWTVFNPRLFLGISPSCVRYNRDQKILNRNGHDPDPRSLCLRASSLIRFASMRSFTCGSGKACCKRATRPAMSHLESFANQERTPKELRRASTSAREHYIELLVHQGRPIWLIENVFSSEPTLPLLILAKLILVGDHIDVLPMPFGSPVQKIIDGHSDDSFEPRAFCRTATKEKDTRISFAGFVA